MHRSYAGMRSILLPLLNNSPLDVPGPVEPRPFIATQAPGLLASFCASLPASRVFSATFSTRPPAQQCTCISMRNHACMLQAQKNNVAQTYTSSRECLSPTAPSVVNCLPTAPSLSRGVPSPTS